MWSILRIYAVCERESLCLKSNLRFTCDYSPCHWKWSIFHGPHHLHPYFGVLYLLDDLQYLFVHSVLSSSFTHPSKTLCSMGSYLSIQNNTNDNWYVKIGSDEAAIKISMIVGLVALPLTELIVAGAGIAAIVNAVEKDLVGTEGMVRLDLGEPTALLAYWIKETSFQSRSFVLCLLCMHAGETVKFGKMTLSLWQQGTCIRFRKCVKDSRAGVMVETLYMRPIFSGATADSNITHDIQYWLHKFGVENPHFISS